MKIVLCGDVVGQSGCRAIETHLPELKERLKPDLIVVNGDNADKFGIAKKTCDAFWGLGVDVITGGDHLFDKKEVMGFISNHPRLLRPANFPKHLPGMGHYVCETASGQKVLVIHLLGQVFIKYTVNSPFEWVDELLENRYILGANIDAIVVDFHGEATSEKMAMAHYLDGRVSMVVGTHTHVPTADAQILPGGTAAQTDAGMCGDYNSVIGFEKTIPLEIFKNKIRGNDSMVPAKGEGTLSGVYVETNDRTGLAERIVPIRMGGTLEPSLP